MTRKQPNNMDILALDLATKTGWSTNIHGRRTGVIEFPIKRGESPGMRFLRCRAWLNEMWELLGGQIDVICYEQAHHRGGAATACCVGLITEVQAFAAGHDIELMAVHTATLKKFSTDSGRASKQEMIEAARERGWNPDWWYDQTHHDSILPENGEDGIYPDPEMMCIRCGEKPEDDNEADACLLLEYALFDLG